MLTKKVRNLDFDQKLIEEVIKRPVLYEKGNSKSSLACRRAWNDIQEVLKKPVEQCRKRWNYIKSTFNRQHIRARKSEEISWPLYEKLKFLESTDLNLENDKRNLNNSVNGADTSENQTNSINCESFTKCGEILLSGNKEFCFSCSTCQEQYKNIEEFMNHALNIHLHSELEASTNAILNLNDNAILKTNTEDTKMTLGTMAIICETNLKSDFVIDNVTSDKLTNKTNAINQINETNEIEEINKAKCESKNISEVNCRKERETKRGVFSCDECDRIFEYRSQLYRHKRLHTGDRPYTCEVCDQTFRHHRNLKDHFKFCHTEERPFPCKYEGCGKKFKTLRIRKLHEILHTNDLPYQCQDCGKCFPQNSYLITHRKTWHVDKNDRRHKCQLCDKTFNSKQYLKFHTYIHTGERPYGCPVCPTRFTRPWSVKEHMKIHDGERNYVCKICGAAFNQIAGLIKHRKRHEEIID